MTRIPGRPASWGLRSVILASVLVGAASAAALEAGDSERMRSLVDRQIEAFRADGGARAFSMASPTLQGMFGSPERFMAMVREAYRAVYRPRSYTFGEVRDGTAGPELSVLIEDGDGVDWTAIYSFERQADGSWAISACRLVKIAEQSA